MAHEPSETPRSAQDDELGIREADCGCCLIVDAVALRELIAGRNETLRQIADELAAEARLLSSGPGDKIRRTTLNIAAKNIRRKIRAHLAAERLRQEVAAHASEPSCGDPRCLFHRAAQSGGERGDA